MTHVRVHFIPTSTTTAKDVLSETGTTTYYHHYSRYYTYKEYYYDYYNYDD